MYWTPLVGSYASSVITHNTPLCVDLQRSLGISLQNYKLRLVGEKPFLQYCMTKVSVWHDLSVPSPRSALLLHLQLECLSGQRQAKNNPHLPTTQEKPFEVVGVFPLFLPPLYSLKTLHSELGGEELQRQQAEGSNREGGRVGANRAEEWKGKTSRMGKKKESWMATAATLHYVSIFYISVHHFLSFLFIAAFTARQLLETRHQSRWKQLKNLLPRHICDPTS